LLYYLMVSWILSWCFTVLMMDSLALISL